MENIRIYVRHTTMNAYKCTEKRWKQCVALESDLYFFDAKALQSKEKHTRSTDVYRRQDGQLRPVITFDLRQFDAHWEQHRGFYLIPNAIDGKTQLRLARACLVEFIEEPSITNMHLQGLQIPRLWARACEKFPGDPMRCKMFQRLHWATAGYHYDWTARKYYQKDFSKVPKLLSDLAISYARACGLDIIPEAVIINFYTTKSSMGGHRDDVEDTMDAPVISMSLGSSCVFLKGGNTKEVRPLEIMLQSGDVAILSQESRLSYHGVAQIIPTAFQIDDEAWDSLLEEESDHVQEYMTIRSLLSSYRININIRQVYPRLVDASIRHNMVAFLTYAQNNEKPEWAKMQHINSQDDTFASEQPNTNPDRRKMRDASNFDH
uniref:Alkylated DNA repair protein alkBlike protein putati n=1 Tax=Albugo laibachii Nc14 TaxID=890382 RepID=F0WKZ3_9STRA|nr:alkylated DNA repair protein alkBlike protein putati [Albugo laibachii Nc14]|eukprot:CCA21952.1 alkylated DNA repair protein alkBlike protein putati [Albugo laibachii Nc14]